MTQGRLLNPPKGGFDYSELVVFPRVKRTGQIANGRIEAGELVTVEGHEGVWKVLTISRGFAHLASLKKLNRSELRGIDYKRLVRTS